MSLRRLALTSLRQLRRTHTTSSCNVLPRFSIPKSGKYCFYLASLASAGLAGANLYNHELVLCEEEENVAADENNYESELAEADRLYSEHKFKELHEYLLQFKDVSNHEILWRVARAHRDRSNMVDVSKEEKKQLIFDAMDVATRALEHGQENFACHKWYGIMLSETGDYLGTKVKLNNAPAMKEHFQRAAELCPTDSTSHYLIGMWCFSFADLSWYERKIATVVFGTPPSSSYEEALEHFEHGESMNPGFYSANQFMLGLMNKKLGKKEEARKWFELLLKFPVKKEEDRVNVKKAEEELKSL